LDKLKRQVQAHTELTQALRAELDEVKRRLEELAKILTAWTDQPPSITLAETEGFRFDSGSADISLTYRASLSHDIVPQILAAQRKHRINTVQVIGHTDEVPLRKLSDNKPSRNLDEGLIPFLVSNAAVTPGSNTDLAMLRAVAVVKVLREHPDLKDMKLVPYSAGQILLPEPEDMLSPGQKGDDAKRRRVVIRLTRS
jgi:flagellar motor protein MotB